MIVLLSWIVFWMNPDNAGDRLAIGLTTILTIMFLSGAINASMPRVSYAKAMDWYLMISFAFVFFSVIESLVVFVLSSRPLGKGCYCKKEVSELQTVGIFLLYTVEAPVLRTPSSEAEKVELLLNGMCKHRV